VGNDYTRQSRSNKYAVYLVTQPVVDLTIAAIAAIVQFAVQHIAEAALQLGLTSLSDYLGVKQYFPELVQVVAPLDSK
jgi:hypothetical protein